MFGSKSKQSSASANGLSQSGIGAFAPKNRIYMGNKPLIDFSSPIEIISFCGLVFVGWYAWKRIE